MGEHASQVQSWLRERLAVLQCSLDWQTEYTLGGTPVDVAGIGPDTLVLVEVEWRRADPVDNTATLFRHLVDGILASTTDGSADSIVVVQLFTDYYDLVRGGVSSKRQNAEFVGDRIAGSFPHVSYHGLSLPLSPPKRGGSLPDDWHASVDAAAEQIGDVLRTRS
jgi:hypothetical protein